MDSWSSRKPDDPPAFNREITRVFGQARDQAHTPAQGRTGQEKAREAPAQRSH